MAYSIGVCSCTIAGILVNRLITSNMAYPSAPPSDLDTNFIQRILIVAIIPATLSAILAGSEIRHPSMDCERLGLG